MIPLFTLLVSTLFFYSTRLNTTLLDYTPLYSTILYLENIINFEHLDRYSNFKSVNCSKSRNPNFEVIISLLVSLENPLDFFYEL